MVGVRSTTRGAQRVFGMCAFDCAWGWLRSKGGHGTTLEKDWNPKVLVIDTTYDSKKYSLFPAFLARISKTACRVISASRAEIRRKPKANSIKSQSLSALLVEFRLDLLTIGSFTPA